jgi:hypothetical protein
MEDYREAAVAVIERLGGIEQVKYMLRDRREFLENILPDTLSKCYPDGLNKGSLPLPDKDVVYPFIVRLVNLL